MKYYWMLLNLVIFNWQLAKVSHYNMIMVVDKVQVSLQSQTIDLDYPMDNVGKWLSYCTMYANKTCV